MPVTYTTRYEFPKPEIGASTDTWGSVLNTAIDDMDVMNSAITTGGSSSAYTLTTGSSLTAYVSGQRFLVKWNHTNGGSATLNVDSLGAKTIKKRDASTNCSASDLVSGAVALLVFDGTNMVLHGYVASDIAAVSQPLDATLTALAAVTYGGSGSPVLQWTAADTVSLTSSPTLTTPTVTSIELGAGTSNTLDVSGGRARIEGDNIVLATSTDTLTNKTLTSPTINGGTASTTLQLSSETTGTLTSASANKKILATGGITLPNSVFAAQQWIIIEGNGTARTITRGSGVTMYINGTNSATGTLTANGIMGVHWRDASICILTGDVS